MPPSGFFQNTRAIMLASPLSCCLCRYPAITQAAAHRSVITASHQLSESCWVAFEVLQPMLQGFKTLSSICNVFAKHVLHALSWHWLQAVAQPAISDSAGCRCIPSSFQSGSSLRYMMHQPCSSCGLMRTLHIYAYTLRHSYCSWTVAAVGPTAAACS